MAELQAREVSRKKSFHTKKKTGTGIRVDLTPMVDLGFLLITFFVFTTTVSQQTSMNLNLPKDIHDPITKMPVPQSGALTLLPGNDDVVYYYFGAAPESLQITNYKNVRNVILEKKKNTPPEKFFIIIRPDSAASYKNVIDILDEMVIDAVPAYALDEISSEEYEAIRRIRM